MPNVISDSSCLIALDNIGMLHILQELYSQIFISEEVLDEFGKRVEGWIVIKRVKNQNYVQMLSNLVDLGEASTIALSFEIEDSLIILDDQKARKLAENLHLKFTGLLGILLKAKHQGIINSVGEILFKLKSVNFRISEKMEYTILQLANEIH